MARCKFWAKSVSVRNFWRIETMWPSNIQITNQVQARIAHLWISSTKTVWRSFSPCRWLTWRTRRASSTRDRTTKALAFRAAIHMKVQLDSTALLAIRATLERPQAQEEQSIQIWLSCLLSLMAQGQTQCNLKPVSMIQHTVGEPCKGVLTPSLRKTIMIAPLSRENCLAKAAGISRTFEALRKSSQRETQ